jgi:hypothetical protein
MTLNRDGTNNPADEVGTDPVYNPSGAYTYRVSRDMGENPVT